MRKGHSIIGLQLISRDTGVLLGKVQDLVFDHDADECIALVLRDKSLLHTGGVVPWHEILVVGKDAVLIKSEESVVDPGVHGRLNEVMARETHLSGTRIVTEDGRDLGTFSEIYLDEASGRVLGYEVSGGFVSDSMSGKRYISAANPSDLRIGANVLLANPALAAEFERQATEEPGGLNASFQSAKNKISDTYDSLASASIEKQKAFVVGKVARRDVFLPEQPMDIALIEGMPFHNEILLVAEGTTITQGDADAAENAGILRDLVLAAGSSVVNDAVGNTVEKMNEKVNDISETASSSATTPGVNTQESAAEAAVGKPSDRNVTLPNGTLLLATGMIITREILATARIYGKEKEVIAAAHLGAASDKAQDFYSSAKASTEQALGTLKTRWSELATTAQEKKASYDASVEKRKINHALGRPVTRVILAQDDAVILNAGDIITRKAVALARDNGVLDILLDSVFEVSVTIAPELLRASQSGQAALNSQVQPQNPLVTSVIVAEPSSNEPSSNEPSSNEPSSNEPSNSQEGNPNQQGAAHEELVATH